jgi:hypothetical protein
MGKKHFFINIKKWTKLRVTSVDRKKNNHIPVIPHEWLAGRGKNNNYDNTVIRRLRRKLRGKTLYCLSKEKITLPD